SKNKMRPFLDKIVERLDNGTLAVLMLISAWDVGQAWRKKLWCWCEPRSDSIAFLSSVPFSPLARVGLPVNLILDRVGKQPRFPQRESRLRERYRRDGLSPARLRSLRQAGVRFPKITILVKVISPFAGR